MRKTNSRFMQPADWGITTIPRKLYFNKKVALTGYQVLHGPQGNALHPVCTFEDELRGRFDRLRETYPAIILSRHHFKMPYWTPDNLQLPTKYAAAAHPERLTTTSVTIALVPNPPPGGQPELGYHFNGAELAPLREKLIRELEQGHPFEGLAGNIGYYMTANLIQAEHAAWSHNNRYLPQFHLPTLKSYLGFHLSADAVTGEMTAGFQGAHPTAVGIRRDGRVEIIPRLQITGYRVELGGQELTVESINPPATNGEKVVLFTPEFQSPEVARHRTNWQSYAPLLPLSANDERVHLFIANEGNGRLPLEKVVQSWCGAAPLPSFGGVLSLERGYFEQLFPHTARHALVGQQVRIRPYGESNFDAYTQILGGLVPAVLHGAHLYDVATASDIQARLQQCANVGSPIAEAGRESRNFALHIREPSGVLVQTAERLGWVLFDGRHELSIGASIVDVARLLKRLEESGAFGGPLLHAAFVDGGSAMKAYAIRSDRRTVALELLNRVAAGSRNGSGVDPDGLNLYTVLKLALKK
ncbi:MAG: hypothetical protein U9Q70_12095 [Chloroflexota bacterium]|nr:hypothetical protein [Chloroflexota bacterium]